MGVERAVLMTNIDPTRRSGCCRSSTQRPDRFALGLGGLNLLRPMENLRALESFVARPPGRVHGRRPELLGRRHVPAERRGVLPALHEVLRARPAAVHEHRAARAAASPARCRTRSTSTACACASPSCKLCMMHGADPWWDVAIRLMIKYAQPPADDVGVVAQSPARVAAALHATRGKDRIMFASDSPVLSITRCIKEAAALDLTPEVLDAYLYQQRPGLLLHAAETDWDEHDGPRANATRRVAARARSRRRTSPRITIDNPERRNAYDPAMRRAMARVPRRARRPTTTSRS